MVLGSTEVPGLRGRVRYEFRATVEVAPALIPLRDSGSIQAVGGLL